MFQLSNNTGCYHYDVIIILLNEVWRRLVYKRSVTSQFTRTVLHYNFTSGMWRRIYDKAQGHCYVKLWQAKCDVALLTSRVWHHRFNKGSVELLLLWHAECDVACELHVWWAGCDVTPFTCGHQLYSMAECDVIFSAIAEWDVTFLLNRIQWPLYQAYRVPWSRFFAKHIFLWGFC